MLLVKAINRSYVYFPAFWLSATKILCEIVPRSDTAYQYSSGIDSYYN